VVIIGAAAALIISHRPSQSPHNSAGQSRNSLASAAAVRSQAVSWITSQVGRDVSVACDAVVCTTLAAHGFPAGNLTVIQPAAPDPYGSVLVIATADVRSQFGSKLGTAYAPEVIASFGTGSSRIDVRVIAPQGPAAFRTALSADQAARKSSGGQLLGNSRITFSAAARAQLAAGVVDSRLLTTIAFVAGQHPIEIVGFGGAAAGASPGVPLRIAYVAETDVAANLSGSAYVSELETVLRAETPPYVPLSIANVQLPSGQPVLEVEFAAPSPLGLLQS
jgi:hypothetical protein